MIEEPVRAKPQRGARIVTATAHDLDQVGALLDLGAPAPVLIVCGRPSGFSAEVAARTAAVLTALVQRTDAIVLDATGCLADASTPDAGAGSRPPVVRVMSRPPDPAAPRGRYTHVLVTDIDAESEQQVLGALGQALAQGMPTAVLAVAELAGEAGDDALTERLTWALHSDQVLKDAWALFAVLDRAAVGLRARFVWFQATILLLGAAATLLAILSKELGTDVLRAAVVVASVAVAGLTALSGRRAAGKRWIVTRAAAESVKSEIFRYRTRTGRYGEAGARKSAPAGRAEVLARRLGMIERRLMHTEVGNSALPVGEGDLPVVGGAGLEPLSAEEYVHERIVDQLRYYRDRLRAYDLRRRILQGIAVAASSAGALVAAAGGQLWVALTSAIAAAPLAYLAHLQVERTIVTYNQSVAQLDDVLRRWHAREPRARTAQAFAALVEMTEAILTAEHGTWVEEMTEAMHHLADQPGDAGQSDDAQP